MSIDGINGINGPNRPDVRGNGGKTERSEAESGRPGDRVELSEQALQIANLTRASKDLPDVRADKVRAVQKALADGTYKVDARQLARQILEFERDLEG